MRNHEPIEIAVPGARRVVGAVTLLLAGAILLGWVPFGAQTFSLTLILVAIGLLV